MHGRRSPPVGGDGELNKGLTAPIFITRVRDIERTAALLTVGDSGGSIKRAAARRAELVKLSGAGTE